MATPNIIEQLGFVKAISVNTDFEQLSESRHDILEQVKDFGIDEVYFCDDEKGNSYPAVFIKRVDSFDFSTLPEIANAHRMIWNFKKVLFLYVYCDTEIRIYNCSEKPFAIKNVNTDYENELQNLELIRSSVSDLRKLDELNKVFSAISIDTGIIWTLEEAETIRKKINLQRRVDKFLVSSLIHTAKQLKNDGLDISFIHKIIMRSLFLLYLEDREATDEKFYSLIKPGAKTYFDILDDVEATYTLYKKLEERFNGNVFTLEKDEIINNQQLQSIKKCFISGNDGTPQLQLFEGWRLFNFSIIQIELLSEIYENFLAEIEPETRQQTGVYYTPPSLVELILNDKLPITKKEINYEIKILDPACGSGIFLVECFKRLVKRYENKHRKPLTDFETLKQLLTDNIFGIELHPQSIKIAAFSLYLALVDNLNPKTIWQEDDKKLPNLISDLGDPSIKVQGHNLFCRDAIAENKEIESITFDLVIGNPPFGTKTILPSLRIYSEQYGFAKESVLPFLHKAVKFCPKGEIALIFNTKILTNTTSTYRKFRHWLFNECYVEKIYNFSILRNSPQNFGGQLFGSATGPISIAFYTKDTPEDHSSRIIYYAPKTFLKSNIIEGVTIDFTDVKYLPREECIKADTKIWKISMWGGMNDERIVNSVLGRIGTLKSYLNKNSKNWNTPRVGLNGDKEKPDFIPDKIINPRLIKRYYTPDTASLDNKKYYRKLSMDIFKPPYVILKKGQQEKRITASYIDFRSFCTTACYIFNGSATHIEKKALVAILNSKITTYFLFMIGSSWGIEREQIFKDEVLEIPAIIQLLDKATLNLISKIFDRIVTINNKSILKTSISELEHKIDTILYEKLNLSEKDLIVIEDSLNYGLDLFENKQNSKALRPVTNPNDYAEFLCKELNDFLIEQELFANATSYTINRFSPLMMVKISFSNQKINLNQSDEHLETALKLIDKNLWQKKSTNIYFRKNMNYKNGNDIYIIRPNQKRYWTQTKAMEDADDLILEILNEV